MAMAESLPPDASTASTGLGLRYIGDYCYAYSGAIPLNNETKTALLFTSGAGVIVAQVQHTSRFALLGSSKIMEMDISMNGVRIVRMSRLTASAHGAIDFDPIYITIPPFTTVEVEVYTDDTQDLANFVTLTGRVYGVEL